MQNRLPSGHNGEIMCKRTLAIIAMVFLAGEAQAFPIEGISTFFSKLFKGSTVSKEAVNAGRAAEGATAAKAAEHLPAGDTANHAAGATLQAVTEPKANTLIEPIATNRKDLDAYKTLRISATKGDSSAMLQMSELTGSGKVSDPGAPYYSYWLIQAARVGNQVATRQLRKECSGHEDLRRTDRWFDSACEKTDGKNLYKGSRVTETFSPSPSSLEIVKKR